MPEKDKYEAAVSLLLKLELKRASLTYTQLAERLGKIGIEEKEANIRNKLARGKFSAVFLVQCLEAIGVNRIEIPNVNGKNTIP